MRVARNLGFHCAGGQSVGFGGLVSLACSGIARWWCQWSCWHSREQYAVVSQVHRNRGRYRSQPSFPSAGGAQHTVVAQRWHQVYLVAQWVHSGTQLVKSHTSHKKVGRRMLQRTHALVVPGQLRPGQGKRGGSRVGLVVDMELMVPPGRGVVLWVVWSSVVIGVVVRSV